MRIFALSDVHVDYDVNARWINNLSSMDYRDDVLILSGDISDSLVLLGSCLDALCKRFRKVLFVPGNHDLWVARESRTKTSLQKFADVAAVVSSSGASMRPYVGGGVRIVPLLGWYDYSFGHPDEELRSIWADYYACRWPNNMTMNDVAAHFAALNELPSIGSEMVITFSHFLPRIDVMPPQIPKDKQILYPILGTSRLERQLRQLGACMHVYGHSHVNRQITIDGVTYINNAFGYPQETRIAAKRLLPIYEC